MSAHSNSRPRSIFVDRGRFCFPSPPQPVDVPENDARPSRVQRKPSRQLLDAQRAAKFGHDITFVGRGRGAKRQPPREQGRRRDGKTGEEAPKKRELFLFSSPFFSQNTPLFAGNAKAENFGAKRERDWPEKTSRPTEPTHDLRGQTARCVQRETRWRASKRIAKVFSPDRNTALSEKVAQRGLKVPLWACAREKNARSRARVERNAYICTSYMAPIRHPAHPLPNR